MRKKPLLTFVLSLVIPILAFLGLMQTDFAKRYALTCLAEKIEKESGLHIEIEKVDFLLPIGLKAKHITVSEVNNPILSVNKLALNISPFTLFKGRLVLSSFEVEGVSIGQPASKKTEKPLSWEAVPFAVEIYNLDVRNLTLDNQKKTLIHLLKGNIDVNPKYKYISATVALQHDRDEHGFLYLFGKQVKDKFKGNFRMGYASKTIPYSSCIGDFTALADRLLLTDLRVSNKGLKGALDITGTLSKEHKTLTLYGHQMEIQGYAIDELSATLDVDHAFSGTFAFACREEKHKIEGNGNISFENESAIALTDIEMKAFDANIQGNLKIDSNGIEGKLKGEAADLSLLSSLTDVELKGACAFQAVFSKQSLSCSLATSSVKAKDWELSSVSLETYIDLAQERWPFTCTLNGDIELNTKGFWHASSNTSSLFLESCKGKVCGYRFALRDTSDIHINQKNVHLSPTLFAIEEGTLYADMDSTLDAIQATLRLEKIPLQPMRSFVPELPATGNLSAQVFLFGSPDKLQGHCRTDMYRVKLLDEAFEKFPPLRVALSASLLSENLECSGKIEGIGTRPIELNVQLPFLCSLTPPKIAIPKDQPISSQLIASGPITPFVEIFAPDTTTVGGDIDAAIHISGTLMEPRVTGHLDLENGFFEGLRSGVLFHQISAHAKGNGSTFVLTDLNGVDRNGGTLSGNGSLELNLLNGFPFDLTVNLTQATLLHLEDARINATGGMRVHGSIKEAAVTGELEVDSARIHIPEDPPQLAHKIEVTYINQSQDERPPTTYLEEEKLWPIAFDLKLNAPGNVRITGDSLQSEWKGSLTIRGTNVSPELGGKLTVQSGEYMLNGKKFEINKGNITFNGDPVSGTTLYVIAAMDVDTFTTEVIVRGPIKKPSITLRSNPPLSQREILSLILFNKRVSEITPFQGQKLNESITDLNKGGKKGPGIISKIQDRLGIDRIDISHNDRSEDQEVSVEVGKYISKRTYVSVRRNMTTAANEVCIGTDLFSHFKLQAAMGNEGYGSVNFLWRNDY